MTKEAALLQFNSVADAGEQLKALGHDDHPNVGNLIFLLQARPLQIQLTWQYYDPWQIEQGNRDQAQENAERPSIAAGPFFFFRALRGWT